jgi:trk system potassium uptake protein TrkA
MAVHVLIVGGGKVGSYLGGLLLSGGHTIGVIERREAEVAALRTALPGGLVVHGSGTDPEVLETAQIRRVDVVAAVTGTDETNLVVATLARFEFGVRRVIARVNHPKNKWMFTPAMGVDVAVDQVDVTARLIAEAMLQESG